MDEQFFSGNEACVARHLRRELVGLLPARSTFAADILRRDESREWKQVKTLRLENM